MGKNYEQATNCKFTKRRSISWVSREMQTNNRGVPLYNDQIGKNKKVR